MIQPALRQHHIEIEQARNPIDQQEVEVEADPDQIKQVIGLAVSDEGPGISPNAMPYVYDPFFYDEGKRDRIRVVFVVHRILDQSPE